MGIHVLPSDSDISWNFSSWVYLKKALLVLFFSLPHPSSFFLQSFCTPGPLQKIQSQISKNFFPYNNYFRNILDLITKFQNTLVLLHIKMLNMYYLASLYLAAWLKKNLLLDVWTVGKSHIRTSLMLNSKLGSSVQSCYYF